VKGTFSSRYYDFRIIAFYQWLDTMLCFSVLFIFIGFLFHCASRVCVKKDEALEVKVLIRVV
jgi:hypothetical protein